MYEPADRKTVMIGCAVAGVSRALVCLHDLPHLERGQLVPYFAGAFAVIAASAALFVVSWRRGPGPRTPVLLYVIALAYALHGQLFRPHYWLAFIEMTAIFPMFFPLAERMLAILYGIGLASFDTVFLLQMDTYVRAGEISRNLAWDVFLATLWTTAMALIAYRGVVALRLRRNLVFRRFFEVGKNLEYALHDVKGLLATPLVYVAVLEQAATEDRLRPAERAALENLREDLTATRDFVLETNRLLLSGFASEPARPVSVSAMLEDARMLLRSKLKHIVVAREGDLTIEASPHVLRQILVSALANSAEAIARNHVEDGLFTVRCEATRIQLSDNSGTGLTEPALRALNTLDRPYSDQPLGSGLGTLIIREQVRALNGTVEFSNGERGVVLTIDLPRSLVRRAP